MSSLIYFKAKNEEKIKKSVFSNDGRIVCDDCRDYSGFSSRIMEDLIFLC